VFAFAPVFLGFPQGTFVVHRIRTAYPSFFVAEISAIGESAVTAGVDVTLPVIAQGWFCGSLRGWTAERFPKRASVVGTRALRPPQKTVSHSGTATSGRDERRRTFECGCAPRLGRHGRTLQCSVPAKLDWVRERQLEDSRKRMRFGWLARTALLFWAVSSQQSAFGQTFII